MKLSVFVPIFIWLSVLLCIWGVLEVMKWQRKRRGERPPFRDRLLRPPGEGLRRKIDSITEDVFFYLSAAPIFPLLIYSIYKDGMEKGGMVTGLFLLLICAVVTGFFIWKAVRLIKSRRTLRVGMAGEMAVAEELNRLMLDGYHVYHDFPADRFNIDHILVGASGVFAVETKARSKSSRGKASAEATVVYDGERLKFPNWVTTEPLAQAKAQAKWLSKWLSGAVGDPVKVSPIVTIPGWYIERKSPNGVPVLSSKNEVRNYLNAQKETVFSEKMIRRICHQLEQKCRDVDLWEWY